MPDLPHVETHRTPPGSVLTVRMPDDLNAEETIPLAEELHRQTGLPVVLLSGDAELSVTTPEEAEAALTETLEDDALEGVPGGLPLAQALLAALRVDGWELVRLRTP